MLDFDMNKIPLPCKKKIDCIDCEEHCERIPLSSVNTIPVNNGKTIKIEIDDQEHELFILFETGYVCSNKITIPAGDFDVSCSVKTNGGIVNDMSITLRCTE